MLDRPRAWGSETATLDHESLLAALHHADSFFPTGGIAFSWGLESLHAQGAVRSQEDVAGFVLGQLQYRWATCDRPVLAAAHAAADSPSALAALDSTIEALTLARELREGSRRAGASLLDVHARLGTSHAAAFRQAVRAGEALGHLPVAQGCVWRGVGLGLGESEAMAGHTQCVGLIGAALRLGIIGHLAGQQILGAAREALGTLLVLPAPSLADLHATIPATEIAAMRHETQSARLFAN
jgi:urease accessory protein